MIFTKLNNQSKSITGAALIIATATLTARLVGLMRDRILAHYFGAGHIMDAYYVAFKIPDLIYTLLIVGALTAGFIPTFTKLFTINEDKNKAWYLANNIFNITGIALIILCIFGLFFAPYIIPIIAPGFSLDNQSLTTSFTRIMFLSPLLLGLSMTLGGILQSLKRFVLYSIAPIFYNLGIIIGAVFLTKIFGPTGLAWGVVIGAFFHLSLMIIGAINSGWKWQPILDLKNIDTKIVGKLMLPRTIGSAIAEINILITTILATLLPIGSVAVYNYASNLQAVPTGIIGIPFALAVFPVLSAAAAKNDLSDFAIKLSETIRKILFLVIPLAILFMLLRAQIVRIILGTGQFDWSATIATADTLAFFSFGLFAQALIPLFSRAFYSLSDTKTPVLIAIFSEIITIILAIILMKLLGVAGLALASSIGASIAIFLLYIFIRKKLPTMESEKIVYSVFKISLASLFMGIVIQMLKYPLSIIFNMNYFLGVFGQATVAGLAGLAIYLLICYILRLPELYDIKEALTRRWFKAVNVKTTDIIDSRK